MSDAFTFVAQVAAAGKLKLEVSFKQRGGTTTDPSDGRDYWACKFVSPESGRVLGEWNNFEDREELFETAARACAGTAAVQLVNWDKQITANAVAARKKVQEEEIEKAKADVKARKAEIEAAVETELAKDTKGDAEETVTMSLDEAAQTLADASGCSEDAARTVLKEDAESAEAAADADASAAEQVSQSGV